MNAERLAELREKIVGWRAERLGITTNEARAQLDARRTEKCKADPRWHPDWQVFMVRVGRWYVGFEDCATPAVAFGATELEACEKALATVGHEPGFEGESPF